MSFRRQEHYVQTVAVSGSGPIDQETADLVVNLGYTILEIDTLRERGYSNQAIRDLALTYRLQFH